MTTVYRLEAAALDPELSEGLSARIADPLWSLTRQWQTGEFRGEDAATPLIVDLAIDVYRISQLRVGPTHHTLDANSPPLEALVEQERPAPKLTYRDRLEAGLALLRALDAAGAEAQATALREDKALRLRLPKSADDGDPVGLMRLKLLARTSFDAARLIKRILDEKGEIAKVDPFTDADEEVLTIVEDWYTSEAALVQELAPGQRSAWRDHRQEYRFGLAADIGADQPLRLHAPEYPGGRLDWFHFDVLRDKLDPAPKDRIEKRMLATPLVFSGQPAQRFWEFEEGDAYFGGMAGGEGDLARSVLAAYAAVAGDDWFVIPALVPANSLARVARLRVFDNFGPLDEKGGFTEDSWRDLKSVARHDLENGRRVWRWQELDGAAEMDPDHVPMVFVPPVLASTRHGPLLEDVRFRRDEGANLAWAIEARYQGVYRRSVERNRPPDPDPPLTENEGDWTYQLGTPVPGHWLPLVPVRITSQNPQVVLRRGRMASSGQQDETEARGVLLTPGRAFVLEESEVPDGGIRVTRRYQAARTASGGTALWVGRRKQPASGPLPQSALEYDALKGWRKRRP